MNTTAETIVTVETPEFVEFLARAQAEIDAEHAKHFSHCSRDILVAEQLDKFIRIWKRNEKPSEYEGRGCAWAFVARVNNTTKGLGEVKAGDLLKPASWKAPAKHARGNIFLPLEAGRGCQPAYLRM